MAIRENRERHVPRRSAQAAGFTAVELALGVALLAVLVLVSVRACQKEFTTSRTVEAVDGLERIGAAAIAHARGRTPRDAFPPSAPLTPPVVPRGAPEATATELWEHPTWTALTFRAKPEGIPHWFAFAFDTTSSDAESTFVARAHGDLDGDGIVSTFQVRGSASASGATLHQGMYVEAETE
jgi:hypothetical protein